MAEALAIETTALRKCYGTIDALAGLDLQVPTGSLFGFLGRNGAGKTTTMKVLLGMTAPTTGTACVFGLAAGERDASVEIRRRAAFVSEDKGLYGGMTVREIVRFTASFYPRWRRDLEDRYRRRFELRDEQLVKTLSAGMRTRLALLLALSRGAELLVLDEPTSGLDPAAAEDVLQVLVGQVAEERVTVFFSSHQIAEVEQIADHVAIVEGGRVAVAGALDDLRAGYCRVDAVFDHEPAAAAVAGPGIAAVRSSGRTLTIWSSAGPDVAVAAARARGSTSVSVSPVSLKELFLETVRREN